MNNKKSGWKKQGECYNCGRPGHYVNKCPDGPNARAMDMEMDQDEEAVALNLHSLQLFVIGVRYYVLNIYAVRYNVSCSLRVTLYIYSILIDNI